MCAIIRYAQNQKTGNQNKVYQIPTILSLYFKGLFLQQPTSLDHSDQSPTKRLYCPLSTTFCVRKST